MDTKSLFSTKPLYRYATCNDLVGLKARYPQYCRCDRSSHNALTWRLKEIGYLFCVDLLGQLEGGRALEVGGGFSDFFDKLIGSTWESWMADKPGFYPEEKYEQGKLDRKETRSVDTLMGEFSESLQEDYFDALFSVSALEHATLDSLDAVYADSYRVLRSGGKMFHTIDSSDLEVGLSHFQAMQRAGFQLPAEPDLSISVRRTDEGPATLFEPLSVVFCNYPGAKRNDMWTKLVSIPQHTTTILVIAEKL